MIEGLRLRPQNLEPTLNPKPRPEPDDVLCGLCFSVSESKDILETLWRARHSQAERPSEHEDRGLQKPRLWYHYNTEQGTISILRRPRQSYLYIYYAKSLRTLNPEVCAPSHKLRSTSDPSQDEWRSVAHASTFGGTSLNLKTSTLAQTPILPLVSREWKNGSDSSYNCTPFLHSLLTKGKLYPQPCTHTLNPRPYTVNPTIPATLSPTPETLLYPQASALHL